MDENRSLSGAILVGGESKRMGSDKALLRFDGSRQLLQQLIEALQSCCQEVLLVGGDPARFDELGPDAR